MRYFARICAHARSWREFAICRFAHFPSFVSVHVDTYGNVNIALIENIVLLLHPQVEHVWLLRNLS